MTLGKRILDLINKSGMNRKELAEKTSLSGAQLTNIIKNGQMPNAKALGEIAVALNTSTDYLLFGHEEFKDRIEEQLIETFRELNYENKLLAVGELTKILTMQKLSE